MHRLDATARDTFLLRPLARSSAEWLRAQNIHFRQYHVWWPPENWRIYFEWSSSLPELHLYWRKFCLCQRRMHVICVKIEQLCLTCANPKQQFMDMLVTSGFRSSVFVLLSFSIDLCTTFIFGRTLLFMYFIKQPTCPEHCQQCVENGTISNRLSVIHIVNESQWHKPYRHTVHS